MTSIVNTQSLKVILQPASYPIMKFNNSNWHSNDNVGFSLGNAADLGEKPLASLFKIRSLYDILNNDPYCHNGSRFRGYCKVVSCSNGENFQHQVLQLDQTHCQSDNPEFENISRILPGLPLAAHFYSDICEVVDAALFHCGLQNEPRPIQTKVHLQRLSATSECVGKASPAQPHKDNSKFLMVFVLGKSNVATVKNSLYDNKLRPIGEFELSPMQYFCLDDRRYYHHVDEVVVQEDNLIGYRDSLILEILPLSDTYAQMA